MGPGEYATQSGFFNGPVSQNLHARNIVRWTCNSRHWTKLLV